MASRTIAFLSGVVAFQQLAQFPGELLWIVAGTLVCLFLLGRGIASRWSGLRIAVGLAVFLSAGFLWAGLRATLLLADSLPSSLEGRDLVVEGLIVGLPELDQGRLRFDFQPEEVTADGEAVDYRGRMRLTWYRRAPQLQPGERWRLTVRLKRPHGMANPGGFDYEAWLFQHRIHATGYVREGEQPALVAPAGVGLDGARDGLRQRLDAALAEAPRGGVLIALAIGDGSRITREEWDLFRETGTTHLMAISGLHVGLVAALAAWGTRRLWRSPRLLHRLAAPQAAALGGLLAAAGYSLLAGFSIPTQRTLVMIAAVALALLVRRHYRPAGLLAVACWAVLLYDPLAVLAPGFWLSFGAVALILFGMGGRLHMPGLWWRWGRVQWLVAVGLAPLLIVFFGAASLSSPVANLLAVPWISLLVVPATLMGTVLLLLWPSGGTALLQWVAQATDLLWPWLELCARWAPTLSWPEPPAWVLVTTLIGVLLLLAPRGWPGRSLGWIWCLPLLLWQPPRPATGEVWLTLLDVGQGLAAVVETHGHVLVFDTGPRFSEEFDTGMAVVAPFLRQRGWRRMDMLVVSHGDSDHSGGARSLLAVVPAEATLAVLPEAMPEIGAGPCRRGMTWQWEGIGFRILHPSEGSRDNDGSCVLRVTAPGGALLLTGDIEARTERALVQSGEPLQARVLLVPHHGSKTSSTDTFVDAVRPEVALFAVGYRNRFRFPHPTVSARYDARHIKRLDSASHGAITLRLHVDGRMERELWRERARRYWHAVPER